MSLGQRVRGGAEEGIPDETRVLAMEIGVRMAHEMGFGPGGKQVVFEVVAEERGVFVGQVVDGGLPSL